MFPHHQQLVTWRGRTDRPLTQLLPHLSSTPALDTSTHMDNSELQDNTVSSTSSQTYEQPATTNETTILQDNEISSTVTSDVQAVMLSLIGFD